VTEFLHDLKGKNLYHCHGVRILIGPRDQPEFLYHGE
jgi:hypothetical protein